MNEKRDQIANLEVLNSTAHRLSEILEEDKVLQFILEQALNTLDARAALIRLLSPDGSELLLSGAVGLSQEYLKKGPVQIADSQIDQRVLENEVVVIEDVTQESDFQYPQAAAQEGLHGMLVLPLMVRERAMGVMRVYMDSVSDLDEADLLLLCTLADLGALSVEKIRLHQSLYRISRAMNSTLELETMLGRVLEAAVREMELKAASIRLLDESQSRLKLVASFGLSESYLAKGQVEVSKSSLDQSVLAGEAVVLYDVEKEPGFQYPEEAAREGIRSVLAVPLRLNERNLGVMRVYSARPRHFTQVAVDFLTSVANLVALAIENASLYAALQKRYKDLELDLADWYRFLAVGD